MAELVANAIDGHVDRIDAAVLVAVQLEVRDSPLD